MGLVPVCQFPLPPFCVKSLKSSSLVQGFKKQKSHSRPETIQPTFISLNRPTQTHRNGIEKCGSFCRFWNPASDA
jgi:hypothetical protein